MHDDIPQPLATLLELAAGDPSVEADAVLSRAEHLEVRVSRGKVEQVEQSTSQQVGIRVLRGGRCGFARTERLTPEHLREAYQAALENASLQDATPVALPAPSSTGDSAALGLYDAALEALDVDALTDFALRAEAAAFAADRRVKVVTDLGVGCSQGAFWLGSTRGLRYQQRGNHVGAYCGVLLAAGEQRKSGGQSWSSRRWDASRAERLGREAVRRGAELLEAKPIPSGRLPIVLDEEVAPQLLGIYLGALSAEAVQKGQSRLAGKLGEQIAVPALSLVDDPHLRGGAGSRLLDGEGTPTAPLTLIENGHLASFLYHIESAAREERTSTGHGARGQGSIHTTAHNLRLLPGKQRTEELLAIPPRCLWITQLEGAAGCHPLSGDISIGVQGFLVEGGRVVQPVDRLTLAGNFFELLQNIQAIGCAYQTNTLTSTHIPALLIESMGVAS